MVSGGLGNFKGNVKFKNHIFLLSLLALHCATCARAVAHGISEIQH